MTGLTKENLKLWIADIARLISNNEDPAPEHYASFLEAPDTVLNLVDILGDLAEEAADDNQDYYAAAIFALDICVAQLQVATEAGNKASAKVMQHLMSKLAVAMGEKKHSLSYWLPVLNAFYDVHAELSIELKDAYLSLASDEDELTPEEEASHLNSIRDLIEELHDLSTFDIAENFFAQSYAMPADFFTDLVLDLYSLEEGKDIALLTLMHPSRDVRDIVVAMHEELMDNITLTPVSLSRLQTIKSWYPVTYHEQFNRWIKIQRKKGVVFNGEASAPILRIRASEVDGSGAQGIFIHLKKNRKHRLCGLLFKQDVGIKDAWITPKISLSDIKRYYDEAFDGSVMLRDVDLSYLLMMVEHFLMLMIQQGGMPDLHLLEMQEELGVHFLPKALDVEYLIEQLSVQITPFTLDSMQLSFKRSKSWPKNKQFTESWYIENADIDKLVNRSCSFVDGVKVCRFKEAMGAVFKEEFERHRERWLFHFLWIALWMKAGAKKNEKIWQDSFFIAYAIHSGTSLEEIPIMQEICHESVVNSIETMHERRTHLNRQ